MNLFPVFNETLRHFLGSKMNSWKSRAIPKTGGSFSGRAHVRLHLEVQSSRSITIHIYAPDPGGLHDPVTGHLVADGVVLGALQAQILAQLEHLRSPERLVPAASIR